jgi:hypothetical protein
MCNAPFKLQQHLVNEHGRFRRNVSTTEAARVLGWLHCMDEGSVASVSEVHATFIFTVEVYRVGEFLQKEKSQTSSVLV